MINWIILFFFVSTLNRRVLCAEDVSHNAISGNATLPKCTEKFMPHECNSAYFYRCVNGDKVLMQCPYELFFNSNKFVCDWPPEGECFNNPNGTCHPRATYFPDRNEPSFFYQCNKGTFFRFQCPKEMVFNFNIGACEFSGKNAPFRPSKPETSRDWVPMVVENSHNVRWPTNKGNGTIHQQPNKQLVCRWKVNDYDKENASVGNQTAFVLKRHNYRVNPTNEVKRLAQSNSTIWVSPRHHQHPLYSKTIQTEVSDFTGPAVNISVAYDSGLVDVKANKTDVIVHFRPKEGNFSSSSLFAQLDVLETDVNSTTTSSANETVLDIRTGTSSTSNEQNTHIRVHLIGGNKLPS